MNFSTVWPHCETVWRLIHQFLWMEILFCQFCRCCEGAYITFAAKDNEACFFFVEITFSTYKLLMNEKSTFLTQSFSLTRSSLFNTPNRKSALRPSKWPPNTPKFHDFSYFHMTYLKSKKKFWGFSQWFWVFRRGGWRTPPRHLTYIFDPIPNRDKNHNFIFYSICFKKKNCI